jgi:hypothetical protein
MPLMKQISKQGIRENKTSEKNLSMLTQNINGLNNQIRRHRIARGLKSKTQPFAAYKKHISLTKPLA